MTTAMQAGTIYRYFRADADHDVSDDTLELSLDLGETWSSMGVDYIQPDDYPPSVIAANTAEPPDAGYVGYWCASSPGPAQAGRCRSATRSKFEAD